MEGKQDQLLNEISKKIVENLPKCEEILQGCIADVKIPTLEEFRAEIDNIKIEEIGNDEVTFGELSEIFQSFNEVSISGEPNRSTSNSSINNETAYAKAKEDLYKSYVEDYKRSVYTQKHATERLQRFESKIKEYKTELEEFNRFMVKLKKYIPKEQENGELTFTKEERNELSEFSEELQAFEYIQSNSNMFKIEPEESDQLDIISTLVRDVIQKTSFSTGNSSINK